MKIFISGIDTFVGAAVRKVLHADFKEKLEAAGEEELPEEEKLIITGSLEGTECPAGVADFALADEVDKIATLASGANCIVLDSHKSVTEATLILKHIRTAKVPMKEKLVVEGEETEEESTKPSIILISTLHTWSKTPKNYPEAEGEEEVEYAAFKEEDYIQRKPSPSFLVHKNLETQVNALSKQGVTTTVLACGIPYGSSQKTLQNFFRDAWMCKPGVLPDLHNGGENFLPMIHIEDMSRAIATTIASPPEQRYVAVVDKSQNTLKEVFTAIYNTLQPGSGELRVASEAETQEMLVADKSWVYLQSDIKFEQGSINELITSDWVCEEGLVANIESIVAEFIAKLDLRPVKIVVLGQPAAGKSTFSAHAAAHYNLPLITMESAIADIAKEVSNGNEEESKVGENVDSEAKEAEESKDADAEDEEAKSEELSEAQLLNKEVRSFEEEGKEVPNYVKHKVMRFILNKPKCRNQGYVLDGLPTTAMEAKRLFLQISPEDIAQWQDEDDTNIEETKEGEEIDLSLVPTAVINLQADEDTLKSRANLADSKAKNLFKERMEQHMANNPTDSASNFSPITFFEKVAALECIQLDTGANDLASCFESAQLCIEQGKVPYNFHPTPEELQEQRTKEAEEARVKAEEEERQQREEELERLHEEEARLHADQVRKLQLEEEEKELLEARSEPLRDYLLKHVMPTLSAGLVECCRVQPEDPIDYLAEYLLRHPSKT